MTPADRDRQIQQFRRDLLEIYRYAGRPSRAELAEKSGRPPELFRFLGSTGLPQWDEISALLTGCGAHSDVDKWRRRWARLNGGARKRQNRHQEPELPEWPGPSQQEAHEERAPEPEPEPATHRAGPIALAMAAATAEDLGEALEQLRLDADVSFGAIGRAAGKALSKSSAQRMARGYPVTRREALVAFVRACGRNEVEAEQWWECAQRVQRGDPPLLQAASIAATELVRRGEERELPVAVVSTPKRTGFAAVRAENARVQGELRQMQARLRDQATMLDSTIRAFRIEHERAEATDAEVRRLTALLAARQPVKTPMARIAVNKQAVAKKVQRVRAYTRIPGTSEKVNIA